MSSLTLSSAVSNGGGAPSNSSATPQWAFLPGHGTPGPGQFTTNDDTYGGTSNITISCFSKDSANNWSRLFFQGGRLAIPSFVIFSKASRTAVFNISAISDDGQGNTLLNGGSAVANGGNWETGDYSLHFAPEFQSLSTTLSASGISPVADGDYPLYGPTSIGSITFVSGICTAFIPPS